MNKTYITTVDVPLKYLNKPSLLYQERPLPESITVDVEGTGFDLIGKFFNADENEIKIDFNASQLKNTGKAKSTGLSSAKLIENNKIFSDPKFRIIKIFPDSLLFDYSKKKSKKVPVALKMELQLKKQYYQSAQPVLFPDSIEIAGEEKDLSSIKFVQTELSTFKNADRNLFFQANIENTPDQKIILSQDKVWVLAPVEEFTEGRLQLAIDKAYYRSRHVILIPDKVEIIYHVALKNYSSVSKEDFRAEVENPAYSITNDHSKLKIKLVKKPALAKIFLVKPETVDYLIER